MMGGVRRPPAASGQQVRYPLAVLDVGLAPRHRLDVLSIGKEQLEIPFQKIPDRLPVDPSALHSHVGYSVGGEPVGELQQVLGHFPEGANLLGGSTQGSRHDKTGPDCLLVDIQATAALVDRFHLILLRRLSDVPSCQKIVLCVLSLGRGDSLWCLGALGSKSFAGSVHQTLPDLLHSVRPGCNIPHRHAIFILLWCSLGAWLSLSV